GVAIVTWLAIGGALFLVLRQLRADQAGGRLEDVATLLASQARQSILAGDVQAALASIRDRAVADRRRRAPSGADRRDGGAPPDRRAVRSWGRSGRRGARRGTERDRSRETPFARRRSGRRRSRRHLSSRRR